MQGGREGGSFEAVANGNTSPPPALHVAGLVPTGQLHRSLDDLKALAAVHVAQLGAGVAAWLVEAVAGLGTLDHEVLGVVDVAAPGRGRTEGGSRVRAGEG